MAKFYTELNDFLKKFIVDQKLFFTATAPIKGRINLSPKGMDTIRIIDNKTVVYLDLTGSGNETAAHLNENSRLTLMFCSFSDKPLVLRLYGSGRVIKSGDSEWEGLYSLFNTFPGVRQIIYFEIESLQTSCGFSVPVYEFKEDRKALLQWAEKKGEHGIQEYWRKNNQTSIDGLPTNILKKEREIDII